jgi:glycosyltransferase involved in cell wall biosynthesis
MRETLGDMPAEASSVPGELDMRTKAARPPVPVSVLMPIKNEEQNLPRALGSVAWADEIFVVDSGSTDGSGGVARSFDAQVIQFKMQGTWPKKKNWALQNLQFKHEWVFIMDADEVLPPEAEEEFRQIVSREQTLAGFLINRRFMFMGVWLKHAYYPNWNLRLFKHRLGRYEKLTDSATGSGDNEVHEHVIVEGETGRLKCEMDHFAFPSIEVFVEKHNRYSNWEACVAMDRYVAGPEGVSKWRDRLAVACKDPFSLRVRMGIRRQLKNFSVSLPFRPYLRFLYVYIWQKGFLDGVAGYYFARMHGFYEFLCVAKTKEMKRKFEAGSKRVQ